MTAEETRTLSAQNINAKDIFQYESITDSIRYNASMGENSYFYDGYLESYTLEKLEKDGFQISLTNHRNEELTTISW